MWQCVKCGLLYTFSPPPSCVICGGEVWITVRFSRLFGGDSGPVWLPRFSAIFSGGSRDNRSMSSVMVQKGGDERVA